MGKVKSILKKGLGRLLPGHAPDFLIIGVQKAGTSSLHYYLDQHPDLVGSRPKEIHYFDKWINYGHDLKWYESHFKNFSYGKKLYFESSPNYIYHEQAAQHIARYLPKIKLLLILRNPVDRAYSAWNMYYDFYKRNNKEQQGKNQVVSTNPIVANLMNGRFKFPSILEVMDLEKKFAEPEPAIIRRGLYYQQIKNYIKYFKRDQLMIIGFNELINNTELVCNKVLHHINLRPFKWDIDKMKIVNKRSYELSLTANERIILQNFYNEPNKQLFEYLDQELDW